MPAPEHTLRLMRAAMWLLLLAGLVVLLLPIPLPGAARAGAAATDFIAAAVVWLALRQRKSA